MFNFWENISRYPRFFISASLGLVMILTTPFQNLLKTRSGIIIFIISAVVIILFLGITLKSMLDL